MQQWRLILTFVLRDVSKNHAIFRLVILTLAIGSLAVLLTGSVLEGFRGMLTESAQGWLGDIVVLPAPDKNTLPQANELAKSILSEKEVESVSHRITSSVGLKYGEKKTQGNIIGVDPETEARTTKLTTYAMLGSFLPNTTDSNGIVLGKDLADSLVGGGYDNTYIPIGKQVELFSSNGNVKKYQVVGIIDGKTFFPNFSIFIQKSELEKFDETHGSTSIIVKLKPEANIEAVKKSIRMKSNDILVNTWKEESGFIDGILKATAFITLIINQLLIISIFIIITIIIYINVIQKRRQIGILKSMGATNTFIVTIYVCEAILYLLLSYSLGAFLFTLLNQYSAEHTIPMPIGDFRTILSSQSMLLYFLILLTAAILGSLVPARTAANTKVIDVIRNSV